MLVPLCKIIAVMIIVLTIIIVIWIFGAWAVSHHASVAPHHMLYYMVSVSFLNIIKCSRRFSWHMWPWSTKPVLSSTGIFVAIANNTLYGSKLFIFFYAKNHKDIKFWSMKIFCKFLTVDISKIHFWLVICIAKNYVWTTLKGIFSIFWFICYQIPDFQIDVSQNSHILTNHTSMESLYIQLLDDVQISIVKNVSLRLDLWSKVTYYTLYVTPWYLNMISHKIQ